MGSELSIRDRGIAVTGLTMCLSGGIWNLVLWVMKAVECFKLKSLSEAKVKSFGLIPLAEEISKQPHLDSVMWFLLFNANENL